MLTRMYFRKLEQCILPTRYGKPVYKYSQEDTERAVIESIIKDLDDMLLPEKDEGFKDDEEKRIIARNSGIRLVKYNLVELLNELNSRKKQ